MPPINTAALRSFRESMVFLIKSKLVSLSPEASTYSTFLKRAFSSGKYSSKNLDWYRTTASEYLTPRYSQTAQTICQELSHCELDQEGIGVLKITPALFSVRDTG